MIQKNVHRKQSNRVKPNPFLKCFDILCLEQYINDKQSNMSEELSDTDSVNSELNNSICYVNNVNSKSDTDEDCKGKSKLKNTNCMHDSKTDSSANTSHKTLQQSFPNKIIHTHYLNMMMDNTTNIGTIESGHFYDLTPKDQDTNTHYINTVD